MSKIVSPCNGLSRCRRHPLGCARIITTAREDWNGRQKRKARRRRLWNKVLDNYNMRLKWGMNPISREYHLNVVLLLEQLLGEEELFQGLERDKIAQSAS